MLQERGISIIVPCYNQGIFLSSNLTTIARFFESLSLPYEIIAVNDGSSDTTATLLEAQKKILGIQVYTHAKNMGKGRAVQTGVLMARYPITLFLDADLAIPITEAKKFLEVFEKEEADIVVASRFVSGHQEIVPVLWYRRILEKAFRMLRKIIIGVQAVQDTQCGFKMFRTDVAQNIFQRLTCSRFSFDAEVLFIAGHLQKKIHELPVALQNPTVSSIRLGKDSLQMLFDLFKIRWNSITGWYEQTEKNTISNITLDDFGMNALINERILGAVTHPRVARVAVMARRSFMEQEVDQLLKSGKKIDIHLELPVRKGKQQVHGTFLVRIGQFLNLILTGELATKKVEKSWREQIEKFRSTFGKLPDGVNSHEHTHFFPTFFLVILRVAKEYKIEYIRLGKKASVRPSLVAWILNVLRIVNRAFVGRPRHTSDTLFSFDWGVHPKYVQDIKSEVLLHVERDEEWVHLASRD